MICRDDIIRAAIELFEKHGIKFSMLSLARTLSTSKRTIYNFFSSKDNLIEQAIDYIFNDIDNQQSKIIKKDISEIQKLKEILLVYPSVINLESVKLNKIIELHPEIYKLIVKHLSDKWELTLSVFENCKKQGYIKDISPIVFRAIVLGIYDKVLDYDNQQMLINQCIEVVLDGMRK